MLFSKRMDRLTEGIFTRLADLKRSLKDEGVRVVDLSVGTPNIPPEQHCVQALLEAASDAKKYVYAIGDTQELLDAAAAWYERRYGVTLDASCEIASLLGSQDGLAHLSMTLIDEGDLALVPEPGYPIFISGPQLAGAELYHMPLKKENGYLVDLDAIPEDIARRAKLMIISYPNNPVTAIAPASFYERVIRFAKEYDIVVLHDNAYSELVFDGVACGSFLAYEGAKDIGIEFNSLSKTYGLAGARIGFALGNSQVIEKLKILKSNIDYGMFLPIQQMAIAAITGDQSCVERMRMAYQRRRDLLCESLCSIGWHMDKCPATMFVWARLPVGYQDSEVFVFELARRTGVLMVPGVVFGPNGEGYVRMALVQDEEEIAYAIERIEESGMLHEN
ncbi:MAG: aminotransferase class I/II-fold pyridoxal phosphate-dependent enzyme [Christensenellales bacterium]|jgi:LL-diaminopimelate aminotransferase